MVFFVAEVMDKEPSLGAIILVGAAVILLGVGLSAFRWWLGLVVAIAAFLLSASLLSEFLDPQITGAIATEAGGRYIGVTYLVALCSVVAPVAAAILKRRRQRISKAFNGGAA